MPANHQKPALAGFFLRRKGPLSGKADIATFK